MNAAKLFDELTTLGVRFEVHEGKLVTHAAAEVWTSRVRAVVRLHEGALRIEAETRQTRARLEWHRQERASYAGYVGALARAYGFGDVVATTAARLVERGARGAAFFVSKTRIEVELTTDVVAIFRRTE